MALDLSLYYATNRNPTDCGGDPVALNQVKAFGTEPYLPRHGYITFGKLTVKLEESAVQNCLQQSINDMGQGDGEALAALVKQERIQVTPYVDPLGKTEKTLDPKEFGSHHFALDLEQEMKQTELGGKGCDLLVYIHGFNVSWEEAVGGALALQLMYNHKRPVAQRGQNPDSDQKIRPSRPIKVILFSWPSNGQMLPFQSYRSDLQDVNLTDVAFARGFLILADKLKTRREENRDANQTVRLKDRQREDCGGRVYLLCHSMGNFVLQKTLAKMRSLSKGTARHPNLFTHAFLCAPDVDADALAQGQPLNPLLEVAQEVSVYFNTEDLAMWISDHTKGNPQRLGQVGTRGLIEKGIYNIDCSDVVHGVTEHSYYLNGSVAQDITQTLARWDQNHKSRSRNKASDPGTFVIKPVH
ncbi:MAG: hypothetical protein A2600_06100 [Candidatus Lambdaproteobacteria bacterium RIFOXYD1_FULL_56_27]|uniref:Alpha/beta hydrolase n=1 Tax=Candidatus Lambdaproteobacteria bacterium RIFOXYD2_FULL_56_26 TaxID=1817773 RepID=A0A1F6GLI2_9PROT|nr:MAG: hypothetical protein A2557_13100 [Candidatus Lambdaproteobacteria bacterium RIFOXYD2_FULL_56_26]OGH05459.1 MAG: hypothetical protein A2426_03670 [Candidatus Lambdaproteobacteria bacterium RIFOXYC1_FULL_56_13]OGH09750.1 MAG: hypothetical protein A2600_06100 [Candidatus Lambdaproteobacteria bacterium RIFOXYD1_FULL_56_27]